MKEYGIILKNISDFMEEYKGCMEKYAGYAYAYAFQSEYISEIHNFCATAGLDSSNSCIEIYEDGGSDFDDTDHFLLAHPVSAKIKEIRELSGLSQDKFGQKYSIPVGTLRNWEQGKRECPDYVLSLLERVVREDFKEA